MCRYNAPWQLQDQSKIFVNDKGHKKYEPAHNDDRLNVHNIPLLSIWRSNVDFQPILSRHAVLKYIAKYASKSERISENYQDMLTRISNVVDSDIPSICAYKIFLAKTIVERDIGAQETCHMLLKLPLVIFSIFVSINVGRKIFKRVSSNSNNKKLQTISRFLELYQNKILFLEHLSLIGSA